MASRPKPVSSTKIVPAFHRFTISRNLIAEPVGIEMASSSIDEVIAVSNDAPRYNRAVTSARLRAMSRVNGYNDGIREGSRHRRNRPPRICA